MSAQSYCDYIEKEYVSHMDGYSHATVTDANVTFRFDGYRISYHPFVFEMWNEISLVEDISAQAKILRKKLGRGMNRENNNCYQNDAR